MNVKIASQENKKITLQVTDLSGKLLLNKVSTINIGETTITLSIADLSAGNYFLKILSSEGVVNLVKKFIKQ